MISLSVWCILIFGLWNAGIVSTAHWDYEHIEQTWPKQCFHGKTQSPIALSADISEGVNFQPFNFQDYDASYPAIIKNNGHTLEIRLHSSTKPMLSGGGLIQSWALDSLHFHWQSEHTIDDTRFPLELHLVHYHAAFKDLPHALEKGRVAVLAVVFYNSPDDDTEFNPIFDRLQQMLQQKVRTNVPVTVSQIELDDFLPRDRAGFYRYEGSLTTPNCTEGVTWTVFTNGLPVSRRQLNMLTRLVTEEYRPIQTNFRPLQNLNDRKVFLKLSSMSGADLISLSNAVKMLMLLSTVVFVL